MQSGDLAELDVEIDAIDRPNRAVAPMHIVQVDGGCG
jgi:hypothetical protein